MANTPGGATPPVGDWLRVLDHASLLDRKTARVTIDGGAVLVARDGEAAVRDRQPVQPSGGAARQGRVTFSGSVAQVTCPAHGSTFDLETGRVLRSPATSPVAAYDARVNEGMIELRKRA